MNIPDYLELDKSLIATIDPREQIKLIGVKLLERSGASPEDLEKGREELEAAFKNADQDRTSVYILQFLKSGNSVVITGSYNGNSLPDDVLKHDLTELENEIKKNH